MPPSGEPAAKLSTRPELAAVATGEAAVATIFRAAGPVGAPDLGTALAAGASAAAAPATAATTTAPAASASAGSFAADPDDGGGNSCGHGGRCFLQLFDQ